MTTERATKKTRIDKPSPSSIKNYESFKKSFPDVHIPHLSTNFSFLPAPLHWLNLEGEKKIAGFLERFASLCYEPLVACQAKSTESDLYPLLFNMLSQLKTTNENFQFEAHLEPHEKPMDAILEAANELASNVRSRRSSLLNVESAPGGTGDQPINPEDEGGLPETADMSSAEDVMKVYLAMEKYFAAQKYKNMFGRAGLVLIGGNPEVTRAIIEVKCKSIDEGLYQCAAYLVLASVENQAKTIASSSTTSTPGVIWGAVSTFQEWRFLRLDGNVITFSDSYVLFSGSRMTLRYVGFAAHEIVAFLFEIFAIDPSIDVAATFEAIDAKANAYAKNATWLKKT